MTDGRSLRVRGVTGRWVRGLTDGRRLRGGVAGWWPRRRPTSDGRKDGWSSRLLHWVLNAMNQESGRVVFDVVILKVSSCAVAIIAWIASIVDRNVKESVRDVLTKVSCMSLCVLVPSQ
jgi:hypothetical protein